jgi:hypothetical protein
VRAGSPFVFEDDGETASGSNPSHSTSRRRELFRGIVRPFSQLEIEYIDRPIAVAK